MKKQFANCEYWVFRSWKVQERVWKRDIWAHTKQHTEAYKDNLAKQEALVWSMRQLDRVVTDLELNGVWVNDMGLQISFIIDLVNNLWGADPPPVLGDPNDPSPTTPILDFGAIVSMQGISIAEKVARLNSIRSEMDTDFKWLTLQGKKMKQFDESVSKQFIRTEIVGGGPKIVTAYDLPLGSESSLDEQEGSTHIEPW